MRHHLVMFVLVMCVVIAAKYLGCADFSRGEWERIIIAAIGLGPAMAGAEAIKNASKKDK